LSLLLVEFNELYARHLCRHSQLGVNVVHLISLFATWYAVYGLLHWLVGIDWVLGIPAVIYLAALVPNVPMRVLASTALFLAFIVEAVIWLPAPWWAYLVIIPVFYKVQAWSHKLYDVEFDMTEFNQKYTKGPVLFVVLLIYEVPIVVNFLCQAHWRAELRKEPVERLQPAARAARLAADNQETAAAKAS